MNFFEHQDRAKRKTKHLIALLVLAVISLVLITCLLIASVLYFSASFNSVNATQMSAQNIWWGITHVLPATAYVWIALGITSIVFMASLFKYAQLKSGGSSVAVAMGGKLLSGLTRDADERKILNVVEEMAIASGTPVPPVYVLEEESINAFAAGFTPQDAVIGVTRGCIHLLNRDELQGVIAHEFSHIFHGDMRINMRLIALLHGILIIGIIGQFCLRMAGSRSRYRSSKDKSPAALLGLGLGLVVIGYSGTFLGGLIKAAVSRQREFLADASAVQFTRNPEGISGALKKIGGTSVGSSISNENAEQFSHMYFGQGVNHFLHLMATHPPLEERIKRINPRWDGTFVTNSKANNSAARESTQHHFSDEALGFAGAAQQNAQYRTADVESSLHSIAQPKQQHLDYAQQCLAEIPSYIKEATADAFSARALVFGFLFDSNENVRARQWQALNNSLGDREVAQLADTIETSARLDTKLRLPVLELCIPALKSLTSNQLKTFINCLKQLINADQEVSLMEWALYRILVHNLIPKTQQPRNATLSNLKVETQQVLSMLAHAGAADVATAAAAYKRGALEINLPDQILAKNTVKLSDIDIAIAKLNNLKPLQKPVLLKALSQCILNDGVITLTEAELLRAIADSLDCPMPPLTTTNSL